MKKFLLLILLSVSVLFTAKAQKLLVYLNNGDQEEFLLSDVQKITPSSTEIILFKTDGTAVSWAVTNIRKWTYDSSTQTSEVNVASIDAVVYPNPVKEIFNIEYTLKQASEICIDILNSNGSLIQNITKEKQAQGLNRVSWENTGLKPGIYFVRISAETQEITKQIVIL